ncbi:uncharacterized protein PHACADRAFT_97404, partial [Phanerochaete carnosa HHB-10118-sp]
AQKDSVESAGQASMRHSAHSTTLDSASHLLWIADTGATSHMTPHKHWLCNYTPMRVAVRLANDHIVYSEGVESVVFAPEVKGKLVRELELSRVFNQGGMLHQGGVLFPVLYVMLQLLCLIIILLSHISISWNILILFAVFLRFLFTVDHYFICFSVRLGSD